MGYTIHTWLVHSHHRGRWTLVGKGPLHLAQGHSHGGECLSWPFTITLPTRPDHSLALDNSGTETYLPLNTLAELPLPGTFYSFNHGWRVKSEGFVEYYLECVLSYSRGGGSQETCTATFPLLLQHPSLENPISRSSQLPQQHLFQHMVRTQRLLPGMEHAELTLKQKTQRLFQSSKVPTFGYKVQVQSPRVIQLGNPSPIPLVIKFSPDPSTTSEDIHNTVQKVQLNSVQMILKCKTVVMAPGNLVPSRTHYDDHSSTYDLGLGSIFQEFETPLVFDSSKENQESDVGEFLHLVLHPSGLQAGDRRLSTGLSICPDFVTCNIKHGHSFEWMLSFSIADETQATKLSTSVRILGPALGNPSPPEYSENHQHKP